MLEYALSFYQEYTRIFYILIAIVVLLEGPIIILTLTILSPQLWIWIPFLFFLSLFWDFWGDLLHFLLGKYWEKLFPNKRRSWAKSPTFQKLTKTIDNYPLLEKLIIIKYTPPITSIGLIYLWVSKVKMFDFIKKDFPLCLLSTIVVIYIGFYFGQYFNTKTNFWWLIFWIWLGILTTITLSRLIWKFLLKKIYRQHSKS